METNHLDEKIGEISMNQIISSIRSKRDQQIEELKKESALMAFLEHYYDTLVISDMKKQFLFKDLTDLKNSPLDLVHYSSLITKLKELKTSTIDGNSQLFLTELRNVFQKHVTKSKP